MGWLYVLGYIFIGVIIAAIAYAIFKYEYRLNQDEEWDMMAEDMVGPTIGIGIAVAVLWPLALVGGVGVFLFLRISQSLYKALSKKIPNSGDQ